MTADIFLVDVKFVSLQTQEKVCMTAQIFLIDVEFVSLQTQEIVCVTAQIFLVDVNFCVSPNSGESLYEGTDFSY